MKFHIVDVFAEGKYSGNQLAVFLPKKKLETGAMQAIAREINFSETTFVDPGGETECGWPVRIFTPGREVEFAGHPTLGTAHVIRRGFLKARDRRTSLLLKVGAVPVEFPVKPDKPYWMEQPPPAFGETLSPAGLAAVLGLAPEAIDGRFPCQEVSTGMAHIIVPLASLDALRAARVERGRYFRLVEQTWAKNILVFCLAGRSDSHQVSVRMFADWLGIAEDPATGSGNGCLAAYLAKHRCLGGAEVSLCAGQGHEIGRPSLLYLHAGETAGNIRVRVGGRVVDVACGEWLDS